MIEKKQWLEDMVAVMCEKHHLLKHYCENMGKEKDEEDYTEMRGKISNLDVIFLKKRSEFLKANGVDDFESLPKDELEILKVAQKLISEIEHYERSIQSHKNQKRLSQMKKKLNNCYKKENKGI